MENKIEVTGCHVCPMSFLNESRDWHCGHPQINDECLTRFGVKILPNCPLKQSSITITLKTKNNGE